jgi:hypothetical protein
MAVGDKENVPKLFRSIESWHDMVSQDAGFVFNGLWACR